MTSCVTQLHVIQRLSCGTLEMTVLLKAELPSHAELKPHNPPPSEIPNSHLGPFCRRLSPPPVAALLLGAPTPVPGRAPHRGPCYHPGRLHSRGLAFLLFLICFVSSATRSGPQPCWAPTPCPFSFLLLYSMICLRNAS